VTGDRPGRVGGKNTFVYASLSRPFDSERHRHRSLFWGLDNVAVPVFSIGVSKETQAFQRNQYRIELALGARGCRGQQRTLGVGCDANISSAQARAGAVRPAPSDHRPGDGRG